jgi:lipopolysaccharide transport system ATP-binding protein
MSSTVIAVEHVSKAYRLGQIGTGTLRTDLQVWWSKARGRPNPELKVGEADHSNRQGETVWALKDVSLRVQQGETLGIIGRNGAGKSTLLKVLSKVTAPTSGEVKINGRIASLLEVGTGFHPELTGRENTYLNGAILGMRRREIDRKFDEIVDFAEIEQFIDTPVKRYSSGMYVRLAFAVAAHLDPEILLVDEVLAVGDAAFQKKCLGKMSDVAHEGRTVLFVSHNMGAVQTLCSSAVFIHNGRLLSSGPSADIVSEYLATFRSHSNTAFDPANPDRSGDGSITLTAGRILDQGGQTTTSVVAGQPLILEFSYENHRSMDRTGLGLTVFNDQGVAVTNVDTSLTSTQIRNLEHRGRFRCVIERCPFPMGKYRVAVAVQDAGAIFDLIPDALTFSVVSSVFYPTGRVPNKSYCLVMVDHHWEHETFGQAEAGARSSVNQDG